MLIHLDTSVLVDAFTGQRRSLGHIVSATAASEVITFSALVHYEWLRGPRTQAEADAVRQLFGADTIVAFGEREASRAASLYRAVGRARQRQADLAIAACAIEHDAQLWTLNVADFDGIPDLTLYRPS
jgi:predicted nucleic acid-binding protein